MLLKTFFLFAVLLLSVYFGVYLQHDSGYVVFVLNDWTVETSIWIALLALILLILSIYLSYSLINKIINIPQTIKRWRNIFNMHRSQNKTRQGLIEFNEGHWKMAKKHLIDALPNAETPLLNYLTAARAAQEMGDNKQRDNFLRQAQQSMPEAKIAVELTQAQLQIANNQWEQALATLQHLQVLSPKHPYVLKLLLELYEEIKDWPQLIKLLPSIKRLKLISNTAFTKKQQHAYFMQLTYLIAQNNSAEIKSFYQSLPKELRYATNINLAYANYLLTCDQHKEAEGLLRKQLGKNVDDELLATYSKLNAEYVNLNYIESLLKHNKTAAINLCLGKICLTKQLWGKAQIYLQESIKILPSRDAYTALGNLYEKENKSTEALTAYRAAAQLGD